MSKRVVSVPLPRRVTGTLRRCQSPETVLAYDEVPLLVPEAGAVDAPVVLEVAPEGGRNGSFATGERFHGGAYWRALDYGNEREGIEPARLGALLLDRLPFRIGWAQNCSDSFHRQEFADWRALAEGCSRRRGLVPFASLAFASVDDDGRAAQAATASRLQGNLLLVDGRLHHRVPAPHFNVDLANPAVVLVRLVRPLWPAEGEDDPRLGARDFALSRLDDALAFAGADAAAFAAENGVVPKGVAGPRFLRLDPPADARPFAEEAGLWAQLVAEACRPVAGFLDDEGLDAYARLRRLARPGFAGEGEACAGLEAVREVVGHVEAARARVVALPNRGLREDDMSMYNDALRVGRSVLLRHDAVERPRLGLATEDEIALEGLAP